MIKKRSNRKALIRILEAFLAVLIVMGGVLFIMARNQTVPDIGDDVYNKQRQILGIIVNDDDLSDVTGYIYLGYRREYTYPFQRSAWILG